jgi:hypothetical protein
MCRSTTAPPTAEPLALTSGPVLETERNGPPCAFAMSHDYDDYQDALDDVQRFYERVDIEAHTHDPDPDEQLCIYTAYVPRREENNDEQR